MVVIWLWPQSGGSFGAGLTQLCHISSPPHPEQSDEYWVPILAIYQIHHSEYYCLLVKSNYMKGEKSSLPSRPPCFQFVCIL